jgi:hypothetical protein
MQTIAYRLALFLSGQDSQTQQKKPRGPTPLSSSGTASRPRHVGQKTHELDELPEPRAEGTNLFSLP